MEITDSKIISGLQAGDYKIYNLLFMKYYSRLCTFVYEFTGSHDSSEDIVQELFIRIWINRRNMAIQNNLSAYMFKAAKNAALNHLRSGKNLEIALKNLPEKNFVIDENFLEQEEFRILLEHCIGLLPGRCSEIFTLSRIDGLKHHEISGKLDISVKTIKNQVWKALTCIKSCLELNGGFR